LPSPAHDSGPAWFATPLLFDSFIRYTAPVCAGARKGFWKGQYGEGHDPGLTYERDSVEVAIRLTSPSKSLDEEMRLIARLKPRDNIVGNTTDDPIPF
jgi:hypothetical protein